MKTNPVAWFEVSVTDMDRAKIFYEKAFDMAIHIVDFGGTKMRWFPNAGEANGATGSLIQQEATYPVIREHWSILLLKMCKMNWTEWKPQGARSFGRKRRSHPSMDLWLYLRILKGIGWHCIHKNN